MVVVVVLGSPFELQVEEEGRRKSGEGERER